MKKEVELARFVVSNLQEARWEVFQEVSCGEGRADIVARLGPLVRVVETKLSLSSALVEQAYWWRPYANYIHVAVPVQRRSRQTKGRHVMKVLLDHLGIGLLEVNDYGGVVETVKAQLRRKIFPRLGDALCDEFKIWGEAGNANNEYYTPWRDTCKRWARYVKMHPGCSLKKIMDECGHHYRADSTARSSMSLHIREGRVGGVRIEREGRLIRLYPDETDGTDEKGDV